MGMIPLAVSVLLCIEMTQQLYMSNGNSATTPNEEDSTKSSTTPLSPTESSDTTPSTPATPATPATPSANLKIVQSINTGRNEINEAVDAITQQCIPFLSLSHSSSAS